MFGAVNKYIFENPEKVEAGIMVSNVVGQGAGVQKIYLVC